MTSSADVAICRWGRPATLALAAFVCLVPGSLPADDPQDAFRAIPWREGPTMGDMGVEAQIAVPEGFIFTGPEGTQQFLQLTENPPNPATVGVLVPTGADEQWVVYFDYHDEGHIKDDDRDAIDADALLSTLQQANAAGNEERRRRGWEGLNVVDWVVPPGYEPSTNRLAWGVRMKSDSGNLVANYDVRLLGRTGYMSVTLACDPEQVRPLVPRLQQLLGGFEFKPGSRYGEWRSGDKVAEYGLVGLIAGGAAVAATKVGLIGKFFALIAKAGKLVVIAVLAAVGGLWRLVFGRKSADKPTV